MKFLADENVEKAVVDALRGQEHDVVWIAESASAMNDQAILALARQEGCVLLTNDKDFGEYIFLQKELPSGIVLLRFRNEDGVSKARFVQKAFAEHLDRVPGRFVVISETRIRFRLLSE